MMQLRREVNMTVYINKIYIRCDDEKCDREEYLFVELGVGGLDDSFFSGKKQQIRDLNQYLEQTLEDKEGHLYGWTAIPEGKHPGVYCPKHASPRILEKQSKIVSEENMLYKKYVVGDFEYFYNQSKYWYAYEINKEGFPIGDSIGTSYRKRDCLHDISWAQDKLNTLRWESNLPEGTMEECEDEIREQQYLSDKKTKFIDKKMSYSDYKKDIPLPPESAVNKVRSA